MALSEHQAIKIRRKVEAATRASEEALSLGDHRYLGEIVLPPWPELGLDEPRHIAVWMRQFSHLPTEN